MADHEVVETDHGTENRIARFKAALVRVQKTGSPWSRFELGKAREDLEAHGEMRDDF